MIQDHVAQLHDIAANLRSDASRPEVLKHITQAQKHLDNAAQAGEDPSQHAAVAVSLGEAANHLQAAAEKHRGTLGEDETPSPELLDVGILGGAHAIVDQAVEAMNRGRNNGRYINV